VYDFSPFKIAKCRFFVKLLELNFSLRDFLIVHTVVQNLLGSFLLSASAKVCVF